MRGVERGLLGDVRRSRSGQPGQARRDRVGPGHGQRQHAPTRRRCWRSSARTAAPRHHDLRRPAKADEVLDGAHRWCRWLHERRADLRHRPRTSSQALQGGKGMFGPMSWPQLGIEPDQLKSPRRSSAKQLTHREQGVQHLRHGRTSRSGKRETRTRVHAVVDFRGAPPPGAAPALDAHEARRSQARAGTHAPTGSKPRRRAATEPPRG